MNVLLRLLPVLGLIPAPLAAQQPADNPLVSNRESDSYAIAEQLYVQARNTADPSNKAVAMHRAAELFRRYTENFPKAANRDKALYLLAVCLQESGDAAASNATLGTLANTMHGEYAAAAAYKLATQSSERRLWDSAIGYYRIAAKETKRNELRNDAQYRLARAYQQAGKRKEAEEAFSGVRTLPGVTPAIAQASLFALAQMKTEDGEDAEAYGLFGNLLQQNGLDEQMKGTATLQAARLAAKLGKSTESQTLYNRLAAIPGMEKYAGEAMYESLLALFNEKKYIEVVRAASSRNTTLDDPVKEARRDLIVGQSNLEIKQYEAAAEWFRTAERTQPGTPVAADAGYRRLICIQQVRRLDFVREAESYLSAYGDAPATANLPCIDLVRLMYADRLMGADPAAAARQFEAINIEQLPEAVRPDALYKKAWCASSGDQYDPVPPLDTFISSYAEDKRLPEALALRGSALVKQGKLSAALADFDRVINDFSDSEAAAVCWQRAAQACATSAPDKMISYYEGLIHYYEALVKRGGKDKPAAIAEAHYNIACALYEKDPAAAVPHFREARTLNAEQYASLVDLRLVQCFFKMKDAENLRVALQTLEQTNQGSYRALPPAILRWCGWSCFQVHDFAAADKYLTDALLREPREKYHAADGSEQERPKVEPIVWKTLARARLELQHYEDGLQPAEFYVSMESQPYRKAEGMRDEALLLIGLKRTKEARDLCEKAIAMGIDGLIKSSLFVTLGDACYAEQQYSEAAKYYGRTANVVSDRELKPAALYKIARALRKCEKEGEAAQYEQSLRSEFPDWTPGPAIRALVGQD
ncbi:MAG: tetratricopeptide repeat protein [Akkermansia sp.]|nr:tetratricopeptide repeat protein [Akkermansia sp.]